MGILHDTTTPAVLLEIKQKHYKLVIDIPGEMIMNSLWMFVNKKYEWTLTLFMNFELFMNEHELT